MTQDRKYKYLTLNFLKGTLKGQIDSIHRTRETQPDKVADFQKAIACRDIAIRASQLTPQAARSSQIRDPGKMTPKVKGWRKAIQEQAARRHPAPPITPAELARLKTEFYTRSQEEDGGKSVSGLKKGSNKGQIPPETHQFPSRPQPRQ